MVQQLTLVLDFALLLPFLLENGTLTLAMLFCALSFCFLSSWPSAPAALCEKRRWFGC